ncbi:cytidylyltransferase domain-containing protein [Roseateles sp. DC23W]|uniref:Cytidylyltransferase domain-containing protein n=1 Tax=Pelomonas dachongensis TaxID=3299029 RepID=A0ABW7EL44_9BURK
MALVQARMGSTRFPGKMMAPLAGRPLLAWVLERLRRAQRIDTLVLATTELPRDAALVELARSMGMATYTGSESDVLDRFSRAARRFEADTVVRVCADNPFIDGAVVDALVDFYAASDCDYACNHLDRLGSGYADGFGAEILPAALLHRLAADCTEPRHREHVTLALWDEDGPWACNCRKACPRAPAALAFPELRFDVDEPGHLRLLQSLVDQSGLTLDSSAQDCVRALLASRTDKRDDKRTGGRA